MVKINKNSKKRLISLLFVLVFMLSISSFASFFASNFDNDVDLETSGINTLYNGKSYPFEIKDVYDDENYTKIYTDAYLQTEIFNNTISDWSGTVVEDEVSVVNNTNYKSPFVNGNYPATYSFENDADGSAPAGWTGNTANYEVNDSHLEHSKVLAGIGDGIGGKSLIQDLGGWKTEGTIEWWWNLNDYSHSYVIFNLRNSTTTMSHRMIAYGASATPIIGCDNGGYLYPTALGWHHYKVEIDCTTNLISYWMDDELLLADKGFRSNFEPDNITSIQLLFSGGVPVGEKVYWDAFGYSWYTGYDIGDNLYSEPISMINGTFDNSDNMKANDDSNSNFTSTERLDYQATYSFEDDANGGNPAGWDIFEGTGCTVNVLASYGTHEKVVELYDNSANSATDYAHMWNTFTPIDDGIIEMWLCFSGQTENRYVQLWEDATFAVGMSAFYQSGGNFYDANANLLQACVINQWYHVKISFDCSGDVFSVWIDGVLKTNAGVIPVDFTNDVGVLRYATRGWQLTNYRLFVDAVGYDWDPNYDIGDNLNVVPAVLNFTVDLNFDEVDTSKLLALDVFSYHYTNISTTIVGNVYDYDSSSYVQMFSSDNVAETENDFTDESSVDDYLDASGNLRLQFTGTNSDSDFELSIDYIKVRFYYKMDITIDKTFYENGLWRYRFKLIGSLHYTDWTVFEVIDPIPNFYAISESDLTTRWILQGSEISPVEDFHDDINTDAWELIDYSSRIFEKYTDVVDYLMDNKSFFSTFTYTSVKYDTYEPRDIFWNGTYWYLIDGANVHEYNWDWTATGSSWGLAGWGIFELDDYWYVGKTDGKVWKYDSAWNYITTIDTSGDMLASAGDLWHYDNFWYVVDYTGDQIEKYTSAWVHTTTYDLSGMFDVGMYNILFSEEEDVWWILEDDTDTMYKFDSSFTYLDVNYPIAEDNYLYSAFLYDGYWYIGTSASDDVYKYKNKYNISKNYFGSGYTYMQTNTTELISLESIDYTTHYNLSSGDYFEVDFQTSSDSQIDLLLLKDGSVNKTLTLSPSGNTNFNKHTVQISVDEFVEFDQLKISSTFEDTDYIKVHDIKTKKYTLTGDFADFLVGSKRDREVYLTPDTYNLRIFEEGAEKINENITIPTTGVLDYVYTPIERLECRLTLFNVGKENHLDFIDYHITVNRSSNGVYNSFELLEPIFSVDEETYIYINVSDRFDTLIDSFERLASEYIDLEIEVYSLQIKNLMEQRTTLDINGSYTYPLLSEDSLYFMLSKEYYQIGYYDSDNDYHQFSIYLNSNQAYELNRSKICFLSYADQQANHLFFENYKTYINGTMLYENIFYEDAGDHVNITITDRYDYEVYQDVYIVTSGDNYIPITLTMYSLKVMNQQEAFNHINITRNPNDSEYYWSEWIAPNEIVEFKLFAGNYIFNLTDTENGWSSYGYTLNGDDVLLISSDNIISNVIYNIANVNVTLGNQITNVQIDLTNQNSEINNTIINIDINLSNVNSSLGTLLTNINLDITNINNNISELFTFTENNFLNLGNNINNSFISIENNIIAINQTISTLVIGLDGKITIVNATINTMFTEMNNQFIVTQSTLNYSFSFLNQTIVQIGNNITENHIALQNLIIQRANEIDNSLIQISTLVNLINSSVVNESLVIQSLVNIIGNNITENHIIINDLINLIGNNITENNINMVNLIELVGNNITTNHFVIQTLIDYVSNNITDNHLEFLTNLNLINNTIGQNQIELINRLLFINNSINTMALDLTNQILLVNNTIYSAILNVSTSIDFNSDNILGNISLTYEQNDFLTELYKETMFSQLLNWSDVAYNYSLMEDRIDVWEFINLNKDDAGIVYLRYQDLIDNLTVSAQNTISLYLPSTDVDYRIWSIADQEYLTGWDPLPENRTVDFGFFEEDIPTDPVPITNTFITYLIVVIFFVGLSFGALKLYYSTKERKNEVPPELVNLTSKPNKKKQKGVVDNRL